MQKNETLRDDPAITAAKSARGMAADLQDELQYAGTDYPLSGAVEHLQAIEKALAKVEGAKKTIEEARLAAAALGRSLEAGKRPDAVTSARPLVETTLAVVGELTGADHMITTGLREPINVYHHTFKIAVSKTPEFAKKGLCTHQAPIELSCGHQCLYCSTPSIMRTQALFTQIHHTAFERGFAVIDPDTPDRIADSIPKGLTRDNVIMVSTTADAWSPEAQEVKLGRRILEVLLEKTPAQVRILTKNAAVANDFDLIQKYPDRVIVGLSTGIPRSQAMFAEILEPNASPPAERFEALQKAHALGLRTYGMLCPCQPGVSDRREHVEELFEEVMQCGVEDIWLEPVNPRGKAITNCEAALRKAKAQEEAEAMAAVRGAPGWSRYATALIETSIAVARDRGVLGKLHVLLYPSGLTPEDRLRLQQYGDEVIWLEGEKER